MKVLFNDTKQILGVYSEDAVGIEGAYSINLPSPIKKKITKTVTLARQKHDLSGKPLYQSNGKETTDSVTKFNSNTPVIEQYQYSRQIGLLDSPAEWTVDDVLQAKYEEMAGRRNVWFTEFLNTEAINIDESVLSSGVFGISLPPQATVEFLPLKLAKVTKSLEFYVEADAALIVSVSVNGGEFVEATPTISDSKLVVSLPVAADNVIVRLHNDTLESEGGGDIPVRALAIFY